MAKSGSTSVTVANYIALKYSWEAGTQNVTGNYTPVNWKLQLISSNSSARISSTASKDYSVTTDGTVKSGTNTVGLTGGTTKTLASGTKNVYHNSDGTKTFNYSFSQEFGITYSGTAIGTKSGSGSGTLDTIPRASVLGTISGFTFGNAITIPITKYSSSFTDTLEISVGGTVIKTVSSITNNASVSFTATELNNIYAKLPSATSGTVTFKLTTKSGSTTIGTSTKTAKGTIPTSVKPAISSVSLVEGTSGLAAAFGAYIQSKSTISGTVNASAGSGSSIETYTIKINGATYTSRTFKTGALKTSGSNTCEVTVKDKRGRTASSTTSFTVTAYSNPAITGFSVVRCNADGTNNDEGAYAKVNGTATITSLSSKNTKSFKLQYKLNGASAWTDIEAYTGGYTYTITNKIVPNISVDNPYDFRIVATDYFGTINSKTIALSTAFTIMDIKANGKGVAFGGVATIDDMLDIRFRKTNLSALSYVGGDRRSDEEKNLYFQTTENAPQESNCKIYGGNGNSGTSLGAYDLTNDIPIWRYFVENKEFKFGPDTILTKGTMPLLHQTVKATGQNTGRMHFSNGLLIQWGVVSITPEAANTAIGVNINYPIAYTYKPNIVIVPQTSAPHVVDVAVGQGSTNVTTFGIYVTRTNTTATTVQWIAIGYKEL